MSSEITGTSVHDPTTGGVGDPTYPPFPDDEIMPSIPGDPVPNPEPEQPSLGIPDPGIYEGTGGSASVESE